jgi:putative transposase
MSASRNITFRLYPTTKQISSLQAWLDLHRELYNAALQERRDAYRKRSVSLSYLDQQNELPEVKRLCPELVPLGSHALQETVRRIDRAFKAFFRRVRQGQPPGFPRFQGRDRFDSFAYPDPAGWKVLNQEGHHGVLQIKNLGHIKMRGKPRVALSSGELRTLTVRRHTGRWYATIGVRFAEEAIARKSAPAHTTIGLDAGCLSLVATSDGKLVENPKHLSCAMAKLHKVQRNLARKKRGSRNRQKARKRVSRLHEQVAERRKDFHHKLSANITKTYSFITVEKLKLKNMSRTARGTKEEPGRNVKAKSGLNRSLMDAGIGQLYSMIAYKAEEAGGRLEKVAPYGTSQRCSMCGKNVPKSLAVRTHHCPHCGYTEDRDINAARNILLLGLSQAGLEQTEVWSPALAGLRSTKPPLCVA